MQERRDDPRRRILLRQKRAAERLRRELLAADGSLGHGYFETYRRKLRDYERTADRAELVAACAEADLVLVGDFHAVPEYQRFAADLLDLLARRGGDLALGIEFLFTRQQHLLDARQAGTLDDDEFLRRVHYREEWGYPWDGFAALLDRARARRTPVFALDAQPRRGYDGIARRDEHAARRIAAILAGRRARRLLVLFGESHLAPSHLPHRAGRRSAALGRPIRIVTVLQNPDGIYWKLAERDQAPARTVRVADGVWAVFHTGPLAKYEAYRQVLERWRGDLPADDEVDLTPAVHHLVRSLCGWLGLRPDRHRLEHRAGWAETLEDAFPEVYAGADARDLIGPILREHRRTPDEVSEARALLEQRGVWYDARSNTVFLSRYLPGRAAAEGARFLRAALTGRLFLPPEGASGDPAARAYGSAYGEALAFLGARLVDPASDYLTPAELRAASTVRVASEAAAVGETAARVAWLEAHARFERGRRRRPPEDLLAALRGERRLARNIARDLGHRLGRRLYDEVRAGRLDARALRTLFGRILDPSRAPAVVLQLLRGRFPRASVWRERPPAA